MGKLFKKYRQHAKKQFIPKTPALNTFFRYLKIVNSAPDWTPISEITEHRNPVKLAIPGMLLSAGKLFFELISHRYEKASTQYYSNFQQAIADLWRCFLGEVRTFF
jgi:hypothetical protein